ncbi:branched-subunit amino acid transport protein AzlD [Kineococcus xinjiangensis]|uniref:Branched-subunit amino acid transport protein AzlD n=1 Tax=Kineococcus xinjiangensis TaxID=512762 RepID=A0A2S6IUY4_9ACTN|nr:AzlD domain-containing protein [Kineococcus xinjiangensis]PPK97963.1 branched-subunit amino acid transport protein AzlD [Kineococcus xinjiangensis]
MTGWLLLACAACFALKLAGYLVPASVLGDARMADAAALVTVALLSALVAVQTVGGGSAGAGEVVLDARLAALVAAAVALLLRAPFVVVVLVGAAVAAGCRALGWG